MCTINGDRQKIGTVSMIVCANSTRVRCAIYSRDTAMRICSVPQSYNAKIRLSKSNHGTKLWASQNIWRAPQTPGVCVGRGGGCGVLTRRRLAGPGRLRGRRAAPPLKRTLNVLLLNPEEKG
jgi:hypothetical protein